MKIVSNYFVEAIKKYKLMFIKSISISLMIAFINILIPRLSRDYIDNIVSRRNSMYMICGMIGFVIIYMLKCLLSILSMRSLDSFGGSYMTDLVLRLKGKLYDASLIEIKEKFGAGTRNILYMDVINVFLTIGHHIPSIMSSIIITVVAFIFSAHYNTKATVTLTMAISIGILLSLISKKSIVKAESKTNLAMKKYDALCSEYMSMLPYVQTNVYDKHYNKEFGESIDNFITKSRKADIPEVFWNETINNYYILLSLAISALLVLVPTTINPLTDLVYFTLTTSIVVNESQKSSALFQSVIKNVPSFKNVDDVLKLACSHNNGSIENVESITISDVKYMYNEKGKSALYYNLTAGRGDVIRVEGGNGKGKSTLLKLIAGQLIPYEGTIFFNDTDIMNISRHVINDRVLYISQNEKILNGTIDEYLNEINGETMDKNDILELYKLCNIDEDISIISDNGMSLSGGQLKKVMLLKLLVLSSKADIILLDEIGAGLDAKSKSYYYDIVNKLAAKHNKIIFYIEHGTTEIMSNKRLAL